MHKLLGLLTLLMFVSGCAMAGNCKLLSVKEYDAAFNKEWLADTANVPNESALGRYLTDADKLRADVKSCKGK